MALTCENCGNAPQVCTCTKDEKQTLLEQHEAEMEEFEEEMEVFNLPREEWFYDPTPKKPWYKNIFEMYHIIIGIVILFAILIIGGILDEMFNK